MDNNLSPTVDVTYLLSHMAKDRSAYPCSSPTRIKIRTIRLTRMVIRVIVFFKGGKILSSISSRELLQMLNKDGWVTKNQGGSHIQLIHPTKPGKITVPYGRKDLPERTVKSILKQAGLIKS